MINTSNLTSEVPSEVIVMIWHDEDMSDQECFAGGCMLTVLAAAAAVTTDTQHPCHLLLPCPYPHTDCITILHSSSFAHL